MPVDRPGSAEAIAKTLLHSPHHAIDRGMPFASHERIHIAGGFAEGLGDQRQPPVRINLDPDGDVALRQSENPP
jgi:hypothetical protein